MTIKDKVDQYKEELDMFPDSIEKYLLDRERQECFKPCKIDQLKTEDWKVHGCMSPVWLVPKNTEGKIEYMSDSDAWITQGVVTIIADVYSGSTPKEIVENELDQQKN